MLNSFLTQQYTLVSRIPPPASFAIVVDGNRLLQEAMEKLNECQPQWWVLTSYPKRFFENACSIIDGIAAIPNARSIVIVFDGLWAERALMLTTKRLGVFDTDPLLVGSAAQYLPCEKIKLKEVFPNEEMISLLVTDLTRHYARRDRRISVMRAPSLALAQILYFGESEAEKVIWGTVELLALRAGKKLVVMKQFIREENKMEIFSCNTDRVFDDTSLSEVNDSEPFVPTFRLIEYACQTKTFKESLLLGQLLNHCPVLKISKDNKVFFTTRINYTNIAPDFAGALTDCFGFMLPPSVLIRHSHNQLPSPILWLNSIPKVNNGENIEEKRQYAVPNTLPHNELAFDGTMEAGYSHTAQLKALSERMAPLLNQIAMHIQESEPEQGRNDPQAQDSGRIILDEWDLSADDVRPGDGDWVTRLDSLGEKSISAVGSSERRATYTPEVLPLAVILKTLDLMGYFTHPTNRDEASGTSVFANALKAHCPGAGAVAPAILFIEACRTEAFGYTPDIALMEHLRNSEAPMLFAAKLLCFLPLGDHDGTAPYDIESPVPKEPFILPLYSFTCALRKIFLSMRTLQQAIAHTTAGDLSARKLNEVLEAAEIFGPRAMPSCFLAHAAYDMMKTPDMKRDQLAASYPIPNLLARLQHGLGVMRMMKEIFLVISRELNYNEGDGNECESTTLDKAKIKEYFDRAITIYEQSLQRISTDPAAAPSTRLTRGGRK